METNGIEFLWEWGPTMNAAGHTQIHDPTAAATLTKAVVRAAGIRQIRQVAVARILGVSAATVSRIYAGNYLLSPERGKEWEFGLLFVRLFRSIDANLGMATAHSNG